MKGVLSVEIGFVIDLKVLLCIICEYVIDLLDYWNLNFDVLFLEGIFVSIENIVVKIWEEIDVLIWEVGGCLCKICFEEMENNFVEYFGGNEFF